ncbi:AbrB/MazE/SpoVT family DNA-binding domain-containing protein [Mitsuaria sp. GD03876]|uniref:AbrB/MazE/SpoVT family DNA-binding domain-containing protein n=1 Tax=Mitsuaria sp. GD03876 TaxID=2975399 RepID=UPI00244A72C3|nr:AbrB/MazE/SpoVT family DNA-binding domain-containing protein [Mitsuaria sp. GD03876]MDH0863082.1 AbrB/MazE/SpoVT family DNA-binding domain-containing protein [Mitsuaria sp. GD03876]
MLAKLTSKNQLTLPKSVTDKLGPVQYFEVVLQAGQVLLTPVRIQRGDAVRAKLAELELGDELVAQAMAFASKAAPAGKAKGAKTAVTAKPARKRGAKPPAAKSPSVKAKTAAAKTPSKRAATPAAKPVRAAGKRKAAKAA